VGYFVPVENIYLISKSATLSTQLASAEFRLFLHLSHLNQWRQGEVHIKDGCFNSRQYNVNNRAKIYHWAYPSPPESSQSVAAG